MLKMKITLETEKKIILPINYINIEKEKIQWTDNIWQRPKNYEWQELPMKNIKKIEIIEE